MPETHSATLRLFFAIELADEIKNKLNILIQHLREQPGGKHLKWSPVEKLHITLRFLGQTSREKMLLCLQQVKEHIAAIPAFNLQLATHIITFPPHHSRMIAMLSPLTVELARLYQAVEQAAVHAGFMPETRPFLPHITLVRVPNWHHQTMSELIASAPHLDLPPQTISYITLFRSDAANDGQVYKVVERLPLNKTSDSV